MQFNNYLCVPYNFLDLFLIRDLNMNLCKLFCIFKLLIIICLNVQFKYGIIYVCGCLVPDIYLTIKEVFNHILLF